MFCTLKFLFYLFKHCLFNFITVTHWITFHIKLLIKYQYCLYVSWLSVMHLIFVCYCFVVLFVNRELGQWFIIKDLKLELITLFILLSHIMKLVKRRKKNQTTQNVKRIEYNQSELDKTTLERYIHKIHKIFKLTYEHLISATSRKFKFCFLFFVFWLLLLIFTYVLLFLIVILSSFVLIAYRLFICFFLDSSGNTTSYCNKTFNGWYHNFDDNKNW